MYCPLNISITPQATLVRFMLREQFFIFAQSALMYPEYISIAEIDFFETRNPHLFYLWDDHNNRWYHPV